MLVMYCLCSEGTRAESSALIARPFPSRHSEGTRTNLWLPDNLPGLCIEQAGDFVCAVPDKNETPPWP
jgi:hypothetical protein